MGVLSCSRPKCNRIMCDTYVPSVGYICAECQHEFENYISAKGYKYHNIEQALGDFMETEKGLWDRDPIGEVKEFFRQYTRD